MSATLVTKESYAKVLSTRIDYPKILAMCVHVQHELEHETNICYQALTSPQLAYTLIFLKHTIQQQSLTETES